MDSAADSASAPGTLLGAERERQGLSRADIAQRLHMSASQVEALELCDYARLPRGTFLRGFVRNYAKVLGLDPNELARALAETAPRDPRPGIVVKSQNIRFDPLAERLTNPYVKAAALTTVALSLGFATMYWWFFIRPAPPAISGSKKPATETARAAMAKPEPVRVEARAEPPRTESAKAEAVRSALPAGAVAEPAGSPPIDAAPVIAAGGSVIRFKFRGNSWVEIKDGRGKVLLSRNNPGGSETEVVGKPPFTVIVGNAPDVTMFYNNQPFDLEPHTRVAVARFVVE